MSLRFPIHSILFASALIWVNGAMAQSPLRVESESRDSAAALVGTQNFTVGRLGRECMSTLGRTQTPLQFVQAWQARNPRYYEAHLKYMVKRLDEALSEGGTVKRDTELANYSAALTRSGDAAVKLLLSSGERKQACERAVALVEGGSFDITSKTPLFNELEALANWAQQH